MSDRIHVDVTVPGREDGLVIARHHLTPTDAAEYVADVAAQGIYDATIHTCTDIGCGDIDITRPYNVRTDFRRNRGYMR